MFCEDIDLSRMLESPKCAIHVASLEDAQALIYNAKKQFPERAVSWSAEVVSGWNTDEIEETCFTMFYDGEDEPTSMSYCDINWFRDAGYEIVEFSELLQVSADIDESDQSIDILLDSVI